VTGVALSRAVDRLVDRVTHWTPSRWAASGGVRATLFHTLAQQIADLAADAEGEPRRPVPRLDNDLVLPDQLRVVARDLLLASPDEPVLARALAAVSRTRTALTRVDQGVMERLVGELPQRSS